MAISIQCDLRPGGYTSKPIRIATITIHTTDDLGHHAFAVGSMAGCKKSIRLVRPKEKSAHRNLLHVLRDFLNEADLDALGNDYIVVPGIDGAGQLQENQANVGTVERNR